MCLSLIPLCGSKYLALQYACGEHSESINPCAILLLPGEDMVGGQVADLADPLTPIGIVALADGWVGRDQLYSL